MEPFETYEHAGLTIEFYQEEEISIFNPRSNDNAGVMVYFGKDYEIGDEQIAMDIDELTIECPRCEGSGEDPERYELLRYGEHGQATVVGAGTFESMESEFTRVQRPDPLHPHQSDGTYGLDPAECLQCHGNYEVETDVITYYKMTEDAVIVIPLRFEDRRYDGAIYETDAKDANAVLYITRKKAQEEWGNDLDGARKYMLGELSEYNAWLQNEVAGYMIKGPDGDELPNIPQLDDSCWGFIGDPDKSGLRESANEAAESVREALDKETAECVEMAARDIITIGGC